MVMKNSCDVCGKVIWKGVFDDHLNLNGTIDRDFVDLDFCSFECLKKHFKIGGKAK